MTITLQSLSIRAFRGIRHERRFEFDGRHAVVVGPNGSGKSTILQALEFLLSGRVSALHGSGTGGVRTTEHVPNQYADPDDTAVQATFETERGEQVRAVREFRNRSRLQASRRPDPFRQLVSAADQGLLHLTRDDLLELVVSTPGNRKAQLYQLMDTEGLDTKRKQLKRLAKRARSAGDDRAERFERELDRVRDLGGEDVVTTIDGDPELRPVELKTAVNARRTRLGGDPIEGLETVDSFRTGLTSPVDQASHPLQRADVQRHVADVQEWFTDGERELRSTLEDLRGELRALRADEDALEAIAQQSLVQTGLELLGPDAEACPLCGEPWARDDLSAHLERRATRLARVDARVERVDALVAEVRPRIDEVTTSLDRLVTSLAETDMDVDIDSVAAYRDRLETTSSVVSGDLVDAGVSPDEVVLPPVESSSAPAVLSELQARADAIPDRSTVETVWDELGALDDAYRAAVQAGRERTRYVRAANELDAVHQTFLAARDDVLEETLASISGQFDDLYGAVNPDEDAFDPTLGQTNTGMEFSVDFYDTGDHPPNALHSEGHQDLMGVCLFLSLATEFTPLARMPVLLDDVVMSVDEQHRTQFATVLSEELTEQFQFLITTHDRSWARQLVDSGLIARSDVIRVSEWTPEGGLTISRGVD